jgi:hypothetical protein
MSNHSQTVTTGFKVKPTETVHVILKSSHSQTIDLGFEAQQETCASRLHVHGADRTQRHPSSQSPGHRVSNMCDHLWSSAQDLLLLPRSSSPHAMPHLTPAHHETSKHDSPYEHEGNGSRITEISRIRIKTSTCQWLITYQTKALTTWFLKDLLVFPYYSLSP